LKINNAWIPHEAVDWAVHS